MTARTLGAASGPGRLSFMSGPASRRTETGLSHREQGESKRLNEKRTTVFGSSGFWHAPQYEHNL